MNKVITINLNGIAYQLEEGGYDALREYLDNAARRLESNPDKDEIIADIEQAIADKFRAVLGAYKTVVATKEVASVIVEMGPVQDASTDEQQAGAAGARTADGQQGPQSPGGAGAESGPRAVRRLYRIYDGAMVSGVCNGLAAYFGVDVTIVRIGFVILTVVWGAGLLAYFLMVLMVPVAKTSVEKAAAQGGPSTAEEFIRRAKAGYYEGMKTFHDKQAHRAWKRKFKQEMRGWKHGFQREMQENAQLWQQNWQQHWAQHPPPPFASFIAWPFLSLFRFVAFVLLLFAVFSLVGDGHVWGVGLPSGIPLWIGVLFLVVFYHLLTWPIKVFRHSCYYQGPGYHPYRPPMAGLWDTLVWLGFFVGMIWLADHYSPQFHEWLLSLPPMAHQFMDSLREWWARR